MSFFDKRTIEHFERWVVSNEQWVVRGERVGTSACSVRREHESYNLTLSRISWNITLCLWRDWRDLREQKPRTLHATSLPLHRSPFNNGTQMTPMRQIAADLFFWQRNKRTYFSFDSSVLMSNLIAHNSLLITQKSVVSVSSVCHSPYLSKNMKKGFGGEIRKCGNIQPSYNQSDANP